MNDSSAIILRRQHSTGLDTRLPVWIKVCQYDESQKKTNLYITTTPHTKPWNIGWEEYAYLPVKNCDEKGPRCVYCVCQMTFNMVTRII